MKVIDMPAKKYTGTPTFSLYDPKATAAQAAEMTSYILDAGLWTQAATHVGVAYYKLGDFTTSQQMFERILTFARQIPNMNVRAGALFATADGLGEAEQGAFAEQILNEGLAILNYIDEAGRTSSALSRIAIATAAAAEGKGSLDDVQYAVTACERVMDNPLRVSAMCAIATTYVNLGRYDLGRDLLKEAVNIAQRVEDDYARAMAYATLARSSDDIGSRAWGFDLMKTALSASQAVLDPVQRCLLSAELIQVLYFMGEETTCEDYVVSAVQAAVTINSPVSRAEALSAIAEAMFKIGRVDRAEQMLKEVLECYHANSGHKEGSACMSSVVKALSHMAEFPGDLRRKVRNAMARSQHLTKEEQESVSRYLREGSEQLAHGRFSVCMKVLRNVAFQIQKFEMKEKEVRERASNEVFVIDADIQKLTEAGVDTKSHVQRLSEAKELFKKKSFEKCIVICSELVEVIKKLKKEVAPKVTVGLPEMKMKPQAWNKIDVRLRNEGGMKCTKARIKFSGPIDVHGQEETMDIPPKGEKQLSLGIYPKEGGLLPVKLMLRYEDVDGILYTEEQDLWVDTQGQEGHEAAHRVEGTEDMTRRLAEILLSGAPEMKGETKKEASRPAVLPPSEDRKEKRHIPRLAGLKAVKKTLEGWKEASSSLKSVEAAFDSVPIPPKALFEISGDVMEDWTFSQLDPKVTEAGGFFRGVQRFYAEAEGKPVCIHLEVSGKGESSNVIIRAFAPDDILLTALDLVEIELDKRFSIQDYKK